MIKKSCLLEREAGSKVASAGLSANGESPYSEPVVRSFFFLASPREMIEGEWPLYIYSTWPKIMESGWFSEEVENSLWPGQAFCLEVEEILHQEKSKYQDILIFQR